MCDVDDFDLIQSDELVYDWEAANELTAEDYVDIFLENFN